MRGYESTEMCSRCVCNYFVDCRMFPATFEYLFGLVAPELERRHNRGRPTISAQKQLLIAL